MAAVDVMKVAGCAGKGFTVTVIVVAVPAQLPIVAVGVT